MASGLTRLNDDLMKSIRLNGGTGHSRQLANWASWMDDMDTLMAARISFTQRLSLQDFKLPATLLQLAATASANILALVSGTHGSASPSLLSEDAEGTTKSDSARICVPIDPMYVAATTVTIRVRCKLSAAAAVSGSIDALVFAADLAGGVSSDLVTTAAQTISTTVANYDFTITPTALTPGTMLDILVTLAINDTAGSGTITGSIYNVELIYNA